MTLRIINLNSSKETEYVYIGRADPEFGLQGSALGNPYTVEQFGRAGAIKMYRRWLWEQIEAEDWRVLAALGELNEDSVLACWCKPEACHGDVVIAAWEWARENRPELLENRRDGERPIDDS
jgi:hypothetical protein